MSHGIFYSYFIIINHINAVFKFSFYYSRHYLEAEEHQAEDKVKEILAIDTKTKEQKNKGHSTSNFRFNGNLQKGTD